MTSMLPVYGGIYFTDHDAQHYCDGMNDLAKVPKPASGALRLDGPYVVRALSHIGQILAYEGRLMSWPAENDAASEKQGWAIFDTGRASGHPPYEIQRIDFPEDGDAPFQGDKEAHEFVRRQAEAGDSLALAALEFLKEHSPEEHATVTESKHEGWDA